MLQWLVSMLNFQMRISLVNEALLHAGIQNRVKFQIDYVNAEELESQDVNEVLKDMDAILVLGGFGERGTEGKRESD